MENEIENKIFLEELMYFSYINNRNQNVFWDRIINEMTFKEISLKYKFSLQRGIQIVKTIIKNIKNNQKYLIKKRRLNENIKKM